MSAPHDEALALQTRHISHPRTGRPCAIELAAGLWRTLDELARDCRTTTAALCAAALLESPDADPAEALWKLLWFAYIRPHLTARPGPDRH